ncbi:hypothetical protein OV450_1537 [Actinobacteria bacterium OV450]|nr:hypothetical protein OV450_1537 [Actinobacteria bacterium OV450]
MAYRLRVAGYPEYEVPIAPGTGPGLTLMVDGFRDSDGMAIEAKHVNHLLAGDPDAFLQVDEGHTGPVRNTSLQFGITFGEQEWEGFALLSPEGVAVKNCTAQEAANFVIWLRDQVVPQNKAVTFNTEWGIEEDAPDEPVPDVTRPRLSSPCGSRRRRRS